MVRVCEPPFPGGDLSLCWWQDLAADLMAGKLRPWLHTPYYLAEIEGELAGYMCCQTPADTLDVGLVEFVWTAETHRRKGIASALLAQLVEEFTEAGGLALYLCTNNPHAGALYEHHGFRYCVGDGMRYLAPGAADFDRDYLDDNGRATVREATWADLPRASALYNHPQPGWFVKDYPRQAFRDTRYESHFVMAQRALESHGGFCLALDNPIGRLVGMATVERRGTFAEQHTGTLSFRVAPGYFDQCGDLLAAAVEKCAGLEIGLLNTYVADCDADQKRLLEEAGFGEEARFENRLRINGAFVDLVVYTRMLAEASKPLRDEGDYYGGRMAWQRERVEALRLLIHLFT